MKLDIVQLIMFLIGKKQFIKKTVKINFLMKPKSYFSAGLVSFVFCFFS